MSGRTEAPRSREERFAEVYDSAYVDLVRFAARRVPDDQAEDVVADVFAVVWRRFEEVPADLGEARAWLFGIARRTLLATNRAEGRRRTLAVRLSDDLLLAPNSDADTDLVVSQVDLVTAWRRLDPVHAETLALAVWDGLTSAQAAKVLDISPVAFRIRLSRARRVLRRYLAISTPHEPSSSRPLTQPPKQASPTCPAEGRI